MKKQTFLTNILLTCCMLLTMVLGASFSVSAAGEISSVEITEIPVMEAGASISDTKAAFTTPEGAIVESNWYIWDSEQESYVIIDEGNFTETDVYYLSVSVKPEDGYTFSEDFSFTYPEGIDDNDYFVWGEETPEGEMTWNFDMTPVSFSAEIFKVELITPEVEAGAIAEIEELHFYSNDSLIDEENFEVEASWYCSTDDTVVTGQAFEAEKVYNLNLLITAKEGYYFSNEVVFVHNGNEETIFNYPDKVEFFDYVSLMPPVERVELSGLTSLEAGDTSVNTLEITNGVDNCEIFVYWFDESGNELIDTPLEDGVKYTVQVEVNLFGDEPISENFVYIIDGTEYQPIEISTETNQAWMSMEYLVGEALTENETENSGMPVIVAGIAFAVIGVTTIAGLVVAFKSRKK